MSTKKHVAKTTSKLSRALRTEDNQLVVTSLVVLLSALVVINASYLASRLSQSASAQASHVLTSHQVASTHSLTASITNMSENSAPDPAFTLDDSEVILIMTLSITNHTSHIQDFIPTSQLYVRTRDGDYRPLHPSMFVTKPIVSGKIKPGQTITGQVSFSVPKASTNPLLYVDTGWNDDVPVVFNVLE